MPLLEHEAQRFAVALDDYEHVSVNDIGGSDESGFWVVVHDQRFELRYEVRSHADYWDFILGLAVGRPLDAATSPARPPAVDPSAATLAARA